MPTTLYGKTGAETWVGRSPQNLRWGTAHCVKKKSSEILGVKMEIFSGKNRHPEILVRENFFRPPKLGARSPPLGSIKIGFVEEQFSCREPFHWTTLLIRQIAR